MKLTRRQLLKQTAGGIGLAAMPAWAAEPCQFGCQTLPYRAHQVARALERAVPHAESVGVTIPLKILFGAGFRGPLAVERVEGKEDASKIPPEVIGQRIAAARNFPVPLLEEHSRI